MVFLCADGGGGFAGHLGGAGGVGGGLCDVLEDGGCDEIRLGDDELEAHGGDPPHGGEGGLDGLGLDQVRERGEVEPGEIAEFENRTGAVGEQGDDGAYGLFVCCLGVHGRTVPRIAACASVRARGSTKQRTEAYIRLRMWSAAA